MHGLFKNITPAMEKQSIPYKNIEGAFGCIRHIPQVANT